MTHTQTAFTESNVELIGEKEKCIKKQEKYQIRSTAAKHRKHKEKRERILLGFEKLAEMASPQSERLAITTPSFTSTTTKALSITPGSRVLKTPLTDEAIWKRLKEAGFDEESIKRRDKAALIAYIAKLEAEVSYFPPILYNYFLFFTFFASCFFRIYVIFV